MKLTAGIYWLSINSRTVSSCQLPHISCDEYSIAVNPCSVILFFSRANLLHNWFRQIYLYVWPTSFLVHDVHSGAPPRFVRTPAAASEFRCESPLSAARVAPRINESVYTNFTCFLQVTHRTAAVGIFFWCVCFCFAPRAGTRRTFAESHHRRADGLLSYGNSHHTLVRHA